MIKFDNHIRRISGSITVNGDKSITHRSVILGAISEGRSRVCNYLRSEDCESTINAFRKMGVKFNTEGSELHINGVGLTCLKEPEEVIDLGNSGTSLRLLTGLLAAQPFFSVLTGDSSLLRRPMKRVIEPVLKMGGEIWAKSGNSCAPIAIKGRQLSGIEYTLPVASAQVKSAIILASLNASSETSIVEPIPSRDHTERMLVFFGGSCEKKGNVIKVANSHDLKGREVNVPGDISSAAYFIVAALICPGSMLEIKGVGLNPGRTGIIDILRNMGARIEIENERVDSGEPVGDIIVFSSDLRGTVIDKELVPRAIDELPIISVAASLAEGETVIKDALELRVKESDRILTMGTELAKLGVDISMLEDGMIIKGRESLLGAQCKSYGDHRVVMSLAIAALRSKGDMEIDNIKSVNTSFPDFFSILNTIGS